MFLLHLVYAGVSALCVLSVLGAYIFGRVRTVVMCRFVPVCRFTGVCAKVWASVLFLSVCNAFI